MPPPLRAVTVRLLNKGKLQVRKQSVRIWDLVTALQDPSVGCAIVQPPGDGVNSAALTGLVIEGTLVRSESEREITVWIGSAIASAGQYGDSQVHQANQEAQC
jgi:hypothetical protein